MRTLYFYSSFLCLYIRERENAVIAMIAPCRFKREDKKIISFLIDESQIQNDHTTRVASNNSQVLPHSEQFVFNALVLECLPRTPRTVVRRSALARAQSRKRVFARLARSTATSNSLPQHSALVFCFFFPFLVY